MRTNGATIPGIERIAAKVGTAFQPRHGRAKRGGVVPSNGKVECLEPAIPPCARPAVARLESRAHFGGPSLRWFTALARRDRDADLRLISVENFGAS